MRIKVYAARRRVDFNKIPLVHLIGSSLDTSEAVKNMLQSFLPKSKSPKPTIISPLPVPIELIERRIFLIRGLKVMISTHLAELYSVEPRALVQAVKRNIDRFPDDFMFQLSKAEFKNLKSQIVISSWGGLRRATPYAFTEHGVAMLSSVLSSQRAVQMNILIIRAFIKLREMLGTNKTLARKSRPSSIGKKTKASSSLLCIRSSSG
jgi:hypothetical protein